MSAIGKYIKLLLSIFNALCVLGMLLCVASTHFKPQVHPSVSYLGLLFPFFALANVLFIIAWAIIAWKRIWISLSGLLLCFGATRAYFPVNVNGFSPDEPIKIMSYNVMMYAIGSKNSWGDNPIAEYINQSGADIVCLQEIGKMEWALSTGRLRFDDYPYVEIIKGKRGGLACLSKYPILKSRNIKYKSAGNSSHAYDILVGEDTLLVINNHFESYKLSDSNKRDYKDLILNTDEVDATGIYDALTDKLVAATAKRGPQVDSVATFIERNMDAYKYIVACGDFNDSPVSYTHYRLTRHLNDAYTSAGNGPGYSYGRHGMFFRLDHILVSEAVKPHSAFVDSDISVSDHYPIHCSFTLDK